MSALRVGIGAGAGALVCSVFLGPLGVAACAAGGAVIGDSFLGESAGRVASSRARKVGRKAAEGARKLTQKAEGRLSGRLRRR